MCDWRSLTPTSKELEIINAVQSSPLTVGQLRAWHYNMPPGRVCRRMVAVNDDGRVIGYSVAAHETWSPPGHFYVWVVVDPDHRGRGAGSELYAGALAFVKSEGATRLASEVRDNCPVSLQFARRRGFEIALAGDGWVGLAAVQLVPQEQAAYNLMTGVARTYRGRKIGLALKVLAARYARDHGALCLRTTNDSDNAAMLAINGRLGYQPQPGKYGLRLERV